MFHDLSNRLIGIAILQVQTGCRGSPSVVILEIHRSPGSKLQDRTLERWSKMVSGHGFAVINATQFRINSSCHWCQPMSVVDFIEISVCRKLECIHVELMMFTEINVIANQRVEKF